jgi:hypothetical protein
MARRPNRRHHLIDQAERMLPEFVLEARDHGATWHEIATALATSPEQAELRCNPGSPVAGTRWPTASDQAINHAT